ncbi:peptidyl-prolyl cis-trans isomerase cyclophilin type (plasmid) [Gemmatirosa kalamazoonensis]|uniref:Peptidyl-prolyl cis-trans isomerase cyclophilin type n=1 Tax=Gemmatirosa kalamazoonensis TaxID=861299 RepID=W0RPY3_9BACT|nr:HEAT repeat domain-containing protein [Gemmatirosa kalamazoonensis]AHG92400.1 peptidyl-prolyl cis-trans isomerase cyclophilin type [Gemmatirosa kalamazoonensis]
MLFSSASLCVLCGQSPSHRAAPPLGAREVDAIATLEMLEDRRRLDTTALAALLADAHAEVRRRAAVAVGRIADRRGVALLRARPLDADTAVAAATVFAVGQLRDSAAVPWLDSLLSAPRTAPTVATEAAAALGKIRTVTARDALERFLAAAPTDARGRATVGEALLAIGRVTARGDLGPIVRWTRSPDEEVRWRATWALFRPRDPAAVPTLLALAADRSPLVRSWAVRGLSRPQADSAGRRAEAEARLLAAARDRDRRVRTEAVRALGTYADSAAVQTLLAALGSADTWLSVSAAEGLARVRDPAVVRALVGATAADHPCALRITALRTLQGAAPAEALGAAPEVARDSVPYCRATAAQVLTALRDTARSTGPRRATPRPGPDTTRGLADYRRLVERWVVPDYEGKPRPRVVWTTPRGAIEIELYPGDAPMAVEEVMRLTASGAIVGTEFTRVVPDFVAQQRPVVGARLQRDEVSRRRLLRGNLSWATAGLDTGVPGYTLGNTPQPHNEGDFTSVGRVVRGLDVVDRLALGDAVTAARVVGP